MTEKQIYIERLAANMRSAGQERWSQFDMSDLCDMAGLWEKWLDTVTRYEEENLALKAAKALGVDIHHERAV